MGGKSFFSRSLVYPRQRAAVHSDLAIEENVALSIDRNERI